MGAPSYDRIMAAMNGTPLEPEPEPPPTPSLADTVALDDPNRLAVMLDAVSARALAKLDEFLSLPIDTSDGNRTRAQSAAINTALATQAKVDELKLRARHSVDRPRLFRCWRRRRRSFDCSKTENSPRLR
jgi:hypothetical protein